MPHIRTLSPLLCLTLAACAAPTGEGGGGSERGTRVKSEPGKSDTSAEAVFMDFELDGEMLTDSSWNPEAQIEEQLMYTVGQLNGDDSVGRIDRIELSEIETEETEDGRTRIRYHARMPVAWGERDDVPDTYTFQLPHDASGSGLRDFVEAYGHDCVDWSAHDVDANIMWYYYRPARYSCELDDADIVELTAVVTPSEIQTTGKFPEYHEIWEDEVFRTVAIFGKYEVGATRSSDSGIRAYDEFVETMDEELAPLGDVSTTPEDFPASPGVDEPTIVWQTSLDDGKSVQVVAMLIDGVRSTDADFDREYRELSKTADLIAYNGHSGLGSNIRALARKGDWQQGQYSIVFMNGCDTYAYVDSALADAHAEVNPDDPEGTKYLDIVMNAMPSYFSSMPDATMALFRGLMQHDEPRTYEEIFADIDRSQVVLVSGEGDNVYVPGYEDDDGDGDDDGEEPGLWEGLGEAGTVAADEERRFETPELAPGQYRFELSGNGDADLYVRIGEAPTTELYDCRPYEIDTNETCVVDLPSSAPVHVMVRGWARSSDWELAGAPR